MPKNRIDIPLLHLELDYLLSQAIQALGRNKGDFSWAIKSFKDLRDQIRETGDRWNFTAVELQNYRDWVKELTPLSYSNDGEGLAETNECLNVVLALLTVALYKQHALSISCCGFIEGVDGILGSSCPSRASNCRRSNREDHLP